MKDWGILYAINLLVPLVMIVLGILMQNVAPKKINWWCGYRTKRSMSSQEAWDFAQAYSGKWMWIVGAVMFVVTAGVWLFFMNSDKNTLDIASLVIVGVQTVLLILTIVPVEIALKKRFGQTKANSPQQND